jgi:hypothetical protein
MRSSRSPIFNETGDLVTVFFDTELEAAQSRVNAVVTSLRRAGIHAAGRPIVARPANRGDRLDWER